MKTLTTTILRGVVFLVPVLFVVFLVVETMSVMVTVAEPLTEIVGVSSIGGIALANIIAAFGLLLFCFVAGLVAKSALVQRAVGSVERRFLQRIPGYSLLTNMTAVLDSQRTSDLTPVLVRFEGSAQVGLEVERLPDRRVVVYLPNSPNAWSGIVRIFGGDQVDRLETTPYSVFEHVEQLGRGTGRLVAGTSDPG